MARCLARCSILPPYQILQRGFSSPVRLISCGWRGTQLSGVSASRGISSTITVDTPELMLDLDRSPSGETTGVAVVWLNRPKSLNSLTPELGEHFETLMKKLAADSSIRAVVLTGKGRGFSAGGDFEWLLKRQTCTADDNCSFMLSFYNRYLSVRRLPVPVIAAINGPCIGAGFCLALACDLRIAAKGIKVGVNFTRLGMMPGFGVTQLLPTLIGFQPAARMLLTGEIITSDEASQHGLFLSLVDADVVLERSLQLARKVAAASPSAVRATLKVLRDHVDQCSIGLAPTLLREAQTQGESFVWEDFRVGLDAVTAHKEPVFPDAE